MPNRITKGLLCEHFLEINEEGIHTKTNLYERRDKWAGVLGIAMEKDRVFIYVGRFRL